MAVLADLGALGRRGLGVLSGRIAAIATQYVLFVVLARLYGPGGVGLFGLTLSVSMVAAVLARAGLDLGAVPAVAADRAARPPGVRGRSFSARTAGPALSASILLGASVGALLWAGSGTLANLFDEPQLTRELRVAGAGMPFLGLLWVAGGLLQAVHRVTVTVWVRDVAHPALMAVGVVALRTLSVPSLPFATVISLAALLTGGTLGLLCLREYHPSWRDSLGVGSGHFRGVLVYSLPLTLVALVNAGTQWTDRLLVGFFLPTAELGLYDSAARVARIVSVSLVASGSVFAPLAAALWKTGERGELAEMYRLAARWSVLLGVPIVALLLVRPESLLALFGQEFTMARHVVRILAAGQLVNVATGPCGYLLIMTGHQRREARYTLISAVLGVTLGAWLIPVLGIEGAALATAVSVSGMNVARVLTGMRLLGMHPLSAGMGKALIAGLATGVGLALVPIPPAWPLLPVVLGQLVFVAGVYVILVSLLRPEPADRVMIASFAVRRGPTREDEGEGVILDTLGAEVRDGGL